MTTTAPAAVGSMTDTSASSRGSAEPSGPAGRPTDAVRSLSGPVGGDAEVAGECLVAVLGQDEGGRRALWKAHHG